MHTDHLGTPRAISNNQNQILWRWEGDQFGDVLPTGNLTFPIRHAGQYYDSETGIFYNYFRNYDPITGRYVESDPIGLDGGLNTYGYVGGNPLHLIDPLGLLQEAAKKCVCAFMKNNNYDAAMAWSNALQIRKKVGWNHSALRPCENYLYAFASITSYGDPVWLMNLGVDFHAAKKLISKNTSSFSLEAYLAGLEGVRDGQNKKDWRKECEDDECAKN